jgi:hypothetical protein
MLEQTVTCDNCGVVRQHPSNWFVIYDQEGEFRIKAWNPAETLGTGARHVCGQNCLFKLIEEFLVTQTKAARAAKAASKKQMPRVEATTTNANLDSTAPHIASVVDIQDYEASTSHVTPPETPGAAPSSIHKPRHAATR